MDPARDVRALSPERPQRTSCSQFDASKPTLGLATLRRFDAPIDAGTINRLVRVMQYLLLTTLNF